MKRLLSVLVVALAALVLLVPSAHAGPAKKVINSPYSRYSIAVWNDTGCHGTKKYLARGYSLSNWVQSYRIGSLKGSATYGGHTYNRTTGVCYNTSYNGTVTLKAWE